MLLVRNVIFGLQHSDEESDDEQLEKRSKVKQESELRERLLESLKKKKPKANQ